MNYALDVDATEVLGVSRDATLQQLHEAYRVRAKKHHPDAGGDAWAFRAVSRAYELLSTARLRSRLADCWPWTDMPEQQAPSPAHPECSEGKNCDHEQSHPGDAPPSHETSWARAGVEERTDDPARVVDVEIFTIRYELGSPLDLLGSPENRNLSSCLSITCPPMSSPTGEAEISPDPNVLKPLRKAFESVSRNTKAAASWSSSGNGRFQGWISYPSATVAGDAFAKLQRALRDAGLGLRQATRELYIARTPR